MHFLIGPGATLADIVEAVKGGEGSGFHGHAGRPGERGGSAPADRLMASPADQDKPAKKPKRRGKATPQHSADIAQLREAFVAELATKASPRPDRLDAERAAFRRRLNGDTDEAPPPQGSYLNEEQRTFLKYFGGATTTIKPAELLGDAATPLLEERLAPPLDFLGQLCSNWTKTPFTILAKRGSGRASYRPFLVTLFYSSSPGSSLIHELGHHLEAYGEWNGKKLKAQVYAYLQRRAANSAYQPLRDFGDGYRDTEYTWADHFVAPYFGKVYTDKSTEILSEGLSYLYSDPGKLAREDPETFDFLIAVFKGVNP